MDLIFSKNILDRAERIKNEFETMTQFLKRAVEGFILMKEDDLKNDREKRK